MEILAVVAVLLWIALSALTARVVLLAQRHAEMRQLEVPMEHVVGGERLTAPGPIEIRSVGAPVSAVAHAAIVVVGSALWFFGGTAIGLVIAGLFSLVMAGFCVRWHHDYKKAMDTRDRDRTAVMPVRLVLPDR